MATEEKQVVEETAVVPGKMEFRLISPTESNFLKHIEWNKEELLAAVRSKVTSYEGIVYTEETVKSAKNDRAELNNLVKAMEVAENIGKTHSITCQLAPYDMRMVYSLMYGMKITNNFLKMHGGIMVRNAARRKCRRK